MEQSFLSGTVSYGQTYGNSSDVNFVVNPKFLGKLGTDEATKKQFEEDVKFLNDFSRRFREQQLAHGTRNDKSRAGSVMKMVIGEAGQSADL